MVISDCLSVQKLLSGNVYYLVLLNILQKLYMVLHLKRNSTTLTYIILNFWQIFSWMFHCLSVQTKLKGLYLANHILSQILIFLDLGYIFTTWIKKIKYLDSKKAEPSQLSISCFPKTNILFIELCVNSNNVSMA